MVPPRHPLAPAKHSWQATTGKIRPTKTHKHPSSSKGSSNAVWHTQQSPSNEQKRPDRANSTRRPGSLFRRIAPVTKEGTGNQQSILVTGPWPLPRSCGVPEQARHLANGERRNQCGTRTPAALTCAAQGASAFHEGTSLERIWNQFANRSTQRSLSKPQGSAQGTRSTCVKLETQRGDRQRQQGD